MMFCFASYYLIWALYRVPREERSWVWAKELMTGGDIESRASSNYNLTGNEIDGNNNNNIDSELADTSNVRIEMNKMSTPSGKSLGVGGTILKMKQTLVDFFS